MLEIGAIIIAVAALYWFFFMRKKIGGSSNGNYEYDQQDDPEAQGRYDKKQAQDIPRLTAKEMLDLSWKFLYDITEIVLYKFSASARKNVHECGKALVQNGMKYNHEVARSPLAYGVTHVKRAEESKGKEAQNQKQEMK
jgi:hypothetical protein